MQSYLKPKQTKYLRQLAQETDKNGNDMNTGKIQQIENFKNQNVLVIGEAMLDKFLVGHSSRLNREAPVPIVDLDDQNLSAGGASNTAVNIVDLGGNVRFISV